MRHIILIGVAFAYLFVACGWQGDMHDHSAHDHHHDHDHEHAAGEIVFPPDKAAAVGLKTTIIEPGTFTEVIKTSGRILAAQGDEQTVVATARGVVVLNHTSFVEGAAVRKGQPILSLATKNLPDGDIATRTRIAYDTAKREYERAKDLADDRIISQREFERIASEYKTAKVACDAIGGQAKEGGLNILSPLNGYLKNLRVKEGDFVETGQPIATISQNNRLQLRAEVSEKYYGSLPLIRSANFKATYNDKVYRLDSLNGRMLSYSKSSDADALYVPVIFEFDNKGDIVSGAFAEIYLLTHPILHAIHIPVSSLIEEQGIYSVFIKLDEECYRKQIVGLGANNGAEVQILSGLKAGDEVVIQAAYHLKLATASNAMPAHTHQH